ncbi:response regulator [Novosphingobium bradum]|uniref:Response regulator n=1 Tax=Novosphingobium bradum TaxID=1737444 RepID=A0ABV7IN86_9SPHN
MIAGKRILLIEDEFLVSAMLEDELAEMGALVVGPAASLAEGLALARAGGFDLAVLDWNLDGESSEPIARALQAAGVPFAISTGYGVVPKGYADCPVLAKPYDPRDLVAVLASLLPPG